MPRAVSPSSLLACGLLALGSASACDPSAAIHDGWRCAGDGDCAQTWRCVDGLCRRTCLDDTGCAAPAICVSGACVTPGAASSSGPVASSSGSAGSSAGGNPSSARTPAPTVLVFSAGGGHGETAAFRVDWCLGETLAAVPAPGGQVAWGLLGTAAAPGGR